MNLTNDEKNIGVNSGEVKSLITDVNATYDKIKEEIETLKKEKNGIEEYWVSEEAGNFTNQVEILLTNFSNFCTRYDNFIEVLNKIMVYYDEEEKSILDALTKYEEEKSSLS